MTHGALAVRALAQFVSTVIPGAKSVDQLREIRGGRRASFRADGQGAAAALGDEIREAQLAW